MSWENVNVTVTLHDDGSPNKAANFQIGSEGVTISIDRIMAIRQGMVKQEMLIASILRSLEDDGVGYTLPAMKAHIEGRTWKWWVD